MIRAMVAAGCLVVVITSSMRASADLSQSPDPRLHRAGSFRTNIGEQAPAAPPPAVAEQPPSVPTPVAAPGETPAPTSPATAGPAEPLDVPPYPAPPMGVPSAPGQEGVHARGYEPQPLSGMGLALSAGGGVAGFFNSGARDAANDGFTWDVRLTLGTRIPVGLDLAYLGSVQELTVAGLDSDALLIGNGAEAALRVQLPSGLFRPYLTGGIGWTHYSIHDSNLTAGLPRGDTIGTVPIGVGLAIGKPNSITFDLRAVGRIAFADDLFDPLARTGGSSSLNSWGVTARLGGEL